jgi:signal transduction histidine kinase
MTSNGRGNRSPTEFAAAALRRALLLPLALATITGALVLGLAEHVRAAVAGKTQDEREVYAVGSICRRLSDDVMSLHHAGSAAPDPRLGAEIPTHLTTLASAARRHARLAGNLSALSNLVREWMRVRERMAAFPPPQAVDEEQRLVTLRARLDELTAELLKDENADEAAVRRRFAEMLTLVAVLSIVSGVGAAIYVRRDLVVVSRAFIQKLDAEQETSRIKDEFVATLSHELKTPINAILGWTTLLRRRSDDPTMVRRALDRIERNARRQARLVDDIVDMSCIVTGKLTLSRHSLDVAPMVESAVASAQSAADMKGIGVAVAVEPDAGSIWGDARRVRQILCNLVDNAVKFAPPGGRVRVGAKRVGDIVELRVSDSGQGLAADFAPHAFEAFRQREASATRAHGGLGLGLAIVQRLVEMHDGTVQVQSPGEVGGATFVVRLPSSARTG